MKGRTFLELLIVLVTRVANSFKSWVIEDEVYGYVGALFNAAKQTSESFLQPWYLVVTSEKFERLDKTNLSLPKLLLGRHNEPFPSKKHGALRLIFPTNEHWRTVTFLLNRSIFHDWDTIDWIFSKYLYPCHISNSTENLQFHSASRRLQNNEGLFAKLLSCFSGKE